MVCKVEEGGVPVRVVNLSYDLCFKAKNIKIGKKNFPDGEVGDSVLTTESNDPISSLPLNRYQYQLFACLCA